MDKKIVFVNQATGYITIDIINEFAKDFDEVAIILGDYREQDFPLNIKVKVSKVVGKSRRTNLHRLFMWLIATLQIHFLLITKYRDYEIFYFTVPPFAYLSSFIIRRKFSVMIFDVYPDVLKNFGIKDNNFVYRVWAYINKKVLPEAHRVYTIGQSMAEAVQKYIQKEKVEIIPLWSGLSDAKPISKKDNLFAIKHQLVDKFVIQYSGNIGHTHDIESLIYVARNLKDQKDICFLIIGRGTKFKYIKNLIAEFELNNCLVLPFQPDEMIKYSLAVADIGVVVVGEKNAQMSIPSKVYNILAVGSALLCISSEDSELSKIVEDYRNGKNFTQESIEDISEYILSLKKDNRLLRRYKKNSLDASKDFTIKNATKIYNAYINKDDSKLEIEYDYSR